MIRWRVVAGIALLVCGVASARDEAGLRRGQQVFEKWCAPCHGAGRGMPGTMALTEKYGGKLPGPLEQRRDLTPEVVRNFVRHGVSVMPWFRKTEISDSELVDLSAWLARER